MKEKWLQQLPKMDFLLSHPQLKNRIPHTYICKMGQEIIEQKRQDLLHGKRPKEGSHLIEEIVDEITQEWQKWITPYFRRILNATGVILHTGLGRAPLAKEVREALAQNSGYCMVEIEQKSGKRGVREKKIAQILQILTGAEAATVVNNNAGATLICLAALARGKEVIVCRGQLVEIGGSFRIPEVMEQSGAILREVGCTNKTHLKDYKKAISENTGLILEVHTSNYRIQGFAQLVPTKDLVALAETHGLPFMYDMGSGNLADLKTLGIYDEPMVQEKLKEGVPLLTFSGDKLLGASQAGIILGKKEMIQKIRNHPLFRALRPGKLDLMALEHTLLLYLQGKHWEKIPSLSLLKTDPQILKKRASQVKERYEEKGKGLFQMEVVEDAAQIGSGALPTHDLPSFSLAIESHKITAELLAETLRTSTPPLFSRIQKDQVWINFHTLFPEEDLEVSNLLLQVEKELENKVWNS